jgi:hypothetical protein
VGGNTPVSVAVSVPASLTEWSRCPYWSGGVWFGAVGGWVGPLVTNRLKSASIHTGVRDESFLELRNSRIAYNKYNK